MDTTTKPVEDSERLQPMLLLGQMKDASKLHGQLGTLLYLQPDSRLYGQMTKTR